MSTSRIWPTVLIGQPLLTPHPMRGVLFDPSFDHILYHLNVTCTSAQPAQPGSCLINTVLWLVSKADRLRQSRNHIAEDVEKPGPARQSTSRNLARSSEISRISRQDEKFSPGFLGFGDETRPSSEVSHWTRVSERGRNGRDFVVNEISQDFSTYSALRYEKNTPVWCLPKTP